MEGDFFFKFDVQQPVTKEITSQTDQYLSDPRSQLTALDTYLPCDPTVIHQVQYTNWCPPVLPFSVCLI
jgi:hypothetical protein